MLGQSLFQSSNGLMQSSDRSSLGGSSIMFARLHSMLTNDEDTLQRYLEQLVSSVDI